MKKIFSSLLFILGSVTFFSCSDNDDKITYSEYDVQDFIWKGLNAYYLYQENVLDLSDTKFSTQNELDAYLSSFPKPETLFENLIYDRKNIDKYSVLFSDYTKLEQILTGNNATNGVEYGLTLKTGSQTEIFGYVKYILPNSDASLKNIKRGDIFYAVNGTALNTNNYRSLLATNDYILNLANFDNGNITPNGKSVSLTKSTYSENPVFMTKVIPQGTNKVGYLMYNGFFSGYEQQLNDAFGQLKTAGITHLVLDLRYNSGGSVATATRIASMITGQFTGQTFAKQQWNSKITAVSDQTKLINNFTATIGNGATINSVNLNKIYILTTKSTASASELIINCLRPYINVVQIGRTTTGKNVGSVTLYDSPNLTKQNLNPNHKYAMQPIVLKIVNKDGFGEYSAGISPTHDLAENLGDLGVLGENTEPYLAKALELINNGGRFQVPKTFKTFDEIIDKSKRDLTSEMYIEQ